MGSKPRPILIATSNRDKFRDWQALLAGTDWVPLPYDGPSPEEDAETYEENAAIKARAAALRTGQPAIGDDNGIAIEALGGAPGLFTRRWAEERGGFEAACDEVVRRALGSPAIYRCGLAWADPQGATIVALGEVPGRIVRPKAPGPGFEPVFAPDGLEHPMPVLPAEVRTAWHSRTRAWQALRPKLTVGR
ncbi:MAG: non-canonical purine NTP pyrophosphatase [Myxococcota bacterium]